MCATPSRIRPSSDSSTLNIMPYRLAAIEVARSMAIDAMGLLYMEYLGACLMRERANFARVLASFTRERMGLEIRTCTDSCTDIGMARNRPLLIHDASDDVPSLTFIYLVICFTIYSPLEYNQGNHRFRSH